MRRQRNEGSSGDRDCEGNNNYLFYLRMCINNYSIPEANLAVTVFDCEGAVGERYALA